MKLILKSHKGIIAVLLCFVVALLVFLFASMLEPVEAREELVAWRPASKPSDIASHGPSDYSDANKTALLIRSDETVVLGGAGGNTKDGPQNSYYSRGWSMGGSWWQLSEISTQGYDRIELSFATRGSNTGPRNFTLEYRGDGYAWLPLKDSVGTPISYIIDADNKFHRHGPYLLSSEVSNLELLHVRFLNTDTVSVAGDATKSSGTNYISDIQISGFPCCPAD